MLVLRVDATPRTGAGHAMRCLNLAEAWGRRDAGQVVVAGDVSLAFVEERLQSLGLRAQPSAEWPSGAVLVVDSYDEVVRREGGLRGGYVRKVLVDDIGGVVPPGYDTVWNPNPYGCSSLYPGFTGTLVTGYEAVPVRADLPRWQGPGSGLVGVALGGGQIAPMLIRLFEGLAERLSTLRFAAVGDWVPPTWERISSHRPWGGLSACATVILAGGTMTWEAAYVGVPVVIVQTADNQQGVAEWAARQEVPVLDLRQRLDGTEELLTRLQSALLYARPLPPIQPASDLVARGLRLSVCGEEGV